MKLKDFYENLPDISAPKSEFVTEVATVCGVSELTVRSWIKGRQKPRNERHLRYLSTVTGIPEDKLFEQ